jgi:cullin-associated NEDD8-dissociated protein 1
MDLHLSHLSLQLASAMLTKAPAVAGPAVSAHIYPKMLVLARSPLVQGQAQQSLIQLFQSVVRANLATVTYADMFAQLYSTANSSSSSSSSSGAAPLSKQGLSNLSKCVAGIASSSQAAQSLQRFTADLQSGSTGETQKQLALHCLGEVGQQQDLSGIPDLQQILLSGFESAAEDTKLSAAYALGHIAVGNMSMFLPMLLQSSASSKHQYLLLVSLKELVVVFANQQLDFLPHLSAVLPLLLQQCQSEEDSVRGMVAECLGVLTTILPEQVLPVLLQLNSDAEDKLSRRMIAHALRFSLSRSASSPAALEAITKEMHQFLPLLQDADLDVKKAALLMVNTAVHHNPSTIEAHVGSAVIPSLIETLQIKLERTVDLGPFKHRVSVIPILIFLKQLILTIFIQCKPKT